jgi:hypothetical protein
VLVSVIVCGLLAPTATFPKDSLVGLMPICACGCDVPVPLRVIVSVEVEALLTIVIAPLGVPAVVGANCALKDMLWPAAITCPALSPLIPKPAPETLADEIVADAVPEFVSITHDDALLLTSTLPKLTVVALGVRITELKPTGGVTAGAGAALVTPAQPESPITEASAARATKRPNVPRRFRLPQVLETRATIA